MAAVLSFALCWASILLAALLWNIASATPSVPVLYCASHNTAQSPVNISIFQSEGNCVLVCSNWALGILQYKSCWCSNVVPNLDDQVGIDECQRSCPGYPSDYCGGEKLFGYIEAGPESPTSTAGVDTSASSSTSSRSVTPASTSSSGLDSTSAVDTEYRTETVKQTVETTVNLTPSKSSTAGSNPTSTSAVWIGCFLPSAHEMNSSVFLPVLTNTQRTTASTTTQHISVQTVTGGGTVSYVTVTYPTEPTSGASGAAVKGATKSTELSAGGIAGIVVGILFAVAALGVIWPLIRRKKQLEAALGNGPAGVMGAHKGVDSSGSRHGSGPDRTWENPQSAKRRSTLGVDPRMTQVNISNESLASLQDNQDYSRRILTVTNPDAA